MNIEKLRKLFEASTDKYGDAKKMGTSYQNIQKILAGADIKVSTLEGIAKFYGVPVGYFFDEANAEGQSSQEIEIVNLKGQIKAYQDTLDRIGFELKSYIIEDL